MTDKTLRKLLHDKRITIASLRQWMIDAWNTQKPLAFSSSSQEAWFRFATEYLQWQMDAITDAISLLP